MPVELLRSALASMSPEGAAPQIATDALKRMVQSTRTYLDMDIAYISEFIGRRAIFREVDAPQHGDLLAIGESHPRDATVEEPVATHSRDRLFPHSRAKPATWNLPVAATLSAPIRLRDGSVYGEFCCLSFTPRPSIGVRDLDIVKIFADLISLQVDRAITANREQSTKRTRIAKILRGDEFSIVLQPIMRLGDSEITGFESLSRFHAEPKRGPDVWFNEAAEVGLGSELEMLAVAKTLAALPSLPPHVSVAFNASPALVTDERFARLLSQQPLERLVVEITEHAPVADYAVLHRSLDGFRRGGMRVAVDDAGAGYSTLRHILDLHPDLIKLDISLTRDIDTDPARRALAGALISFAHQTGSRIVAEGVETRGELEQLRKLGAEMAQGYLLGRPARLEDALESFRSWKAAAFAS